MANAQTERMPSDMPTIQLHSELHSDPLAIRHWGHANWAEHLQARPGKNLVRIDQAAELRLTPHHAKHQISLMVRQLGRLVASEGTVQALGEIARKNHLTQDWNLFPDLALQSFSGMGLQWNQSLAIAANWQWQLGVQGLLLRHLTARNLQGDLSYQAASQTYVFHASSLEQSSRLQYPFQEVHDRAGQALLFQTQLKWNAGPLDVEIGVKDWGWLRWQNLPTQKLQLNSNVRELDANGYLVYKPLLHGQNRQSSVLWRAPWTAETTVQWAFGSAQKLSLPWQYIPDFGWLPAARWTDARHPVQWAVEWRQHDRNVVLYFQWKNWGLDWGLDNLDHASRNQVWRVSYRKNF